MFRIIRKGNTLPSRATFLLPTRSMATASNVQLKVGEWPVYYRPDITSESSKKASELLQENHEKHHAYFNQSGFHNHIAHHLLTLWALGASPEDISKGYDVNQSYQRPPVSLEQTIVEDMHDPARFMKYQNREKYYNDFLKFFQGEIEKTSWQDVLKKYVFAGDERAESMLIRLYSGFLHPVIHVGFGVEFHQPAIIAEGLSQTATHDAWIGKLLLPIEKAANERRNESSKGIAQLLDDIRADKELLEAPHWSDGNKIRDGILKRAPGRMIDLASQFHVKPDELEEKTAEMANASALFTAGAQRDDRIVKFDFFLMHNLNSSIFFSAFLKQDWITDAQKVRLLEWKVWMDLGMYASRKSPEIRLDIIRDYKPKTPSGWDGIQDRVISLEDDGHASKLIRALAHGQEICKPYENKDAFRVKQDDWLQMGHMAIDSVEAGEPHWVRSTGFDEAWADIPAKAQL